MIQGPMDLPEGRECLGKRESEQNSKCLEFEVRKTRVRQATHIGCRTKEALTLRPCPALA